MSELRIGSLFSGYGGLDMAALEALGGGRVVWHSDVKPASVALLKHRYPDVPNLGDMTAIDYSTAPPIDVLAASWPCQPHSAAGKRLGEKDPRALWPHVARAVAETRPAIFFGENVARIASNGELRRVVRSLADLGYVGAWRCIRASDVGACHRRDRCFVVAVDPAAYAGRSEREGTGSAGRQVGRLRTIDPTDEPTWSDRSAGLSLLPTPRSCDGQRGHSDANRIARRGGRTLSEEVVALLPTPKASDGTKGGPGMRGSSGDLMLPSAVMQLLPTPLAGDGRGGRNATAGRSPSSTAEIGWNLNDVVRADRWGIYTDAIARHEQVLGRPAPEPTQVSLKNGNPQLSARFVEWMMMLPEGHVTDVPGLVDSPRKSERNAMLSLLGDGVVPAQGAAAFRFLLAHLVIHFDSEVAA